MRRRALIGGGAAVAASGAAHAQTAPSVARVGVLIPAAPQFEAEAFSDGLRDAGFVEGRNLRLDVRSADGATERLPALARGLVEDGVDVVLAVNSPAALAAARATSRTPVVFSMVANPILLGLVDSLARPGGNVTGISNMGDEIVLKRLDLLRQAAPGATRILAIYHPDDPVTAPQLAALASSAASLGAEHLAVPVREVAEVDSAFDRGARWGANGLLRVIGLGGPTDLPTIRGAQARRLPSMFVFRDHAAEGALLAYFADRHENFRRSAAYVARILRGERPGDLPIERPTKFNLYVNARSARELGLVLPPSLLVLADEVFE